MAMNKRVKVYKKFQDLISSRMTVSELLLEKIVTASAEETTRIRDLLWESFSISNFVHLPDKTELTITPTPKPERKPLWVDPIEPPILTRMGLKYKPQTDVSSIWQTTNDRGVRGEVSSRINPSEELPMIATNDPPLFIEDSSDDEVVDPADPSHQNFSIPRTLTRPSTTTARRPSTISSAPRAPRGLYPYNQSRDWLIGQIRATDQTTVREAMIACAPAMTTRTTYGYPNRPKLETLILAGSSSLPKLLSFIQSFPTKWSEMPDSKFLGIDIDVPRYLYNPRKFIVCPVTRQAADKPLLLPCGHVISESALSKTVQASRGRGIKCPVCPQEITNTSTARMYI
jgi:hypothetical protein